MIWAAIFLGVCGGIILFLPLGKAEEASEN
jgi:hypothetical protein